MSLRPHTLVLAAALLATGQAFPDIDIALLQQQLLQDGVFLDR